jgi:hypothetical protein
MISASLAGRRADSQRSGAGAHFRAAMPAVIAGTMQKMGKMDFKAEVKAAYCQQSGKLCDK